jgi:transcriptional regulator with XRE-family HTH domain
MQGEPTKATELSMLGERLRKLREAKSWSQAHLADAARVNIRTVQRIESGEPASQETMLSLAAALDVDLVELEPDGRASARAATFSRTRLVIALLCIAPAALFILVNLLRSVAGMSGPFDALAATGGRVISFEAFNLISPIIFLGGTAAAFLLCLPTLVRIRATRVGRNVLSINGVELRAQKQALAVIVLAILSATVLVGYAALELLHTPVS